MNAFARYRCTLSFLPINSIKHLWIRCVHKYKNGRTIILFNIRSGPKLEYSWIKESDDIHSMPVYYMESPALFTPR